MKKYLYAGVLSACLAAPAYAGTNKFVAQKPEEPLHRRTIVLCMAIVLGLELYKHRPQLPARKPYST
ncbi:hypothetical protein [Duganella callida]|uniref:Uncharacterized protein n=1 Tax=Duganella callida TaxID=2561932 RepID=A0A4Y9T0B9_9BURK|nr:hypothetical protein [Duganella callida]TFW30446.1 hypothetical protein E4L98_02015 [Duganella callida]